MLSAKKRKDKAIESGRKGGLLASQRMTETARKDRARRAAAARWVKSPDSDKLTATKQLTEEMV